MTNYVYVLDINGKPLMPTKNCAKVRILLKSGKAKPVGRDPFTIQLLYETTGYTQPVTVGVDAGYAHIGVCASTEKQVVYQAQIEERCDIVGLLKERREKRGARRNRNLRHREARFDNRVHSKHKGWLPPSIEQKIDTHLTVVKKLCKILPVTKIRVETAEFDIHKLKNPEVKGIDYQRGEKYGHYNTRNYVLWRDGHKCRCCGKPHDRLYVVSADGSKTVAPENLYTVCKPCMEQHLKSGRPFNFNKKRHFAPPTQMGIMRPTLMKRMRATFTEGMGIPVEQTCGYITKGLRDEYGIRKTHVNDAYCIAGNMDAEPLDMYYLQKKVRCHNRQLHKCTVEKGGYRKNNQAPYLVKGFRLNDTVRAKGQTWFIHGRREKGSFVLRKLDGTKLEITPSKIRYIHSNNGMLTERVCVG